MPFDSLVMVLEEYIYSSFFIVSGKTQHEVPKQKTAFFVRLKKHLKLTTNEVVKFDTVQTNHGNGYDITTGIFTVPAAGVYEITVNFLSGSDSKFLELNLMKNQEVVGRAHAALDQFTSSSLQAILRLKPGDKIYVRQPRSYGNIYGDNYTMMSGHLVY